MCDFEKTPFFFNLTSAIWQYIVSVQHVEWETKLHHNEEKRTIVEPEAYIAKSQESVNAEHDPIAQASIPPRNFHILTRWLRQETIVPLRLSQRVQ